MSEVLSSTDDRLVSAQVLYLVTDQSDKELMAMPLSAILRQKLCFRLVMLALTDRERRLILQKTSASRQVYPGKWSIFFSPVRSGDSRQDTALRLLRERTDIQQDLKVNECSALPPSLPERPYSIALYTARPSPGSITLISQRSDIMLVDEDELNGLTEGDSGMFAPPLLELRRLGLIFPG